jgi:hypothetical protein
LRSAAAGVKDGHLRAMSEAVARNTVIEIKIKAMLPAL